MVNFDHARIARASLVAGVIAAGLGLSGCMGSPTYGTDKTANQQLVEDVTGILSIGPKRGPKIDYKPRPELVTPETTAVLPPPQDDVTTASNSAWPESPEARLARIRAEADENSDNPAYRPNVIFDEREHPGAEVTYNDPLLSNMSNKERLAELRRRRNEQARGSTTSRQFLSEPPIDYRQPAASAPTDDLGEPEWKKERSQRRGSGSVAETYGSRPNSTAGMVN